MGKNIYHDRVVRSDETAIVCVNCGQLVIAILMLKLDANEYFVFKKIWKKQAEQHTHFPSKCNLWQLINWVLLGDKKWRQKKLWKWIKLKRQINR